MSTNRDPDALPGPRRWLEISNLLIALSALAVSVFAYGLGVAASKREEVREREASARQVVFSTSLLTGAGSDTKKPTIDGYVVTVGNYGPFPVEDVNVEGDEPVGLLSGDDLPGGVVFTGTDPEIPAWPLGTLGACQSVSFRLGDFEPVRVTFADANGVAWSRKQASPPVEGMPDKDVERASPDLRQGLVGLKVRSLGACG